MAAEEHLELPDGALRLRRHPYREGSSLRAWDAADLRLIDAMNAADAPADNLLLVGDTHGALACCLAGRVATSVLDSAGSQVATRRNLAANDLDRGGLRLITCLQLDERALPASAVLMKVPRDNDVLQRHLAALVDLLPAGTPLLAGVMARRLSKGAISLFERTLGGVEISRAVRKARVLRGTVGGAASAPKRPKIRSYRGPDGVQIEAWPSVFGARRLDVGAEALLPHVRAFDHALTIVDLGCGTGVLGLVAAARCPQARVVFVDDSALAIDSARRSWAANASRWGGREATMIHADELGALEDRSVDLVLCNPPFHQQHALTRQTAAAMFAEAHRVLRPGGTCLVVGNRHLGYEHGLRRIYPRVHVAGNDRRFMVIKATRG